MFHHTQEIECNGRIRSVQTLAFTHAIAPIDDTTIAQVGQAYFTDLHRLMWPLLQLRHQSDGGEVIALCGLVILAFRPPQILPWADGVAIRYPIATGLMTQRAHPHQGYLQIGIGPHELSLTVAEYYSSVVGRRGNGFRKQLYLRTQSALHVMLARKFLLTLAARLHQR